jgi:ribose 1,5-bisphosphokinase PhnN
MQNDVAQRRDMLMNMAQRCAELAERLDDRGRPLTSDEQMIVRLAMMPAIKEEFEIAVTHFLVGGDVEEALQRLAEVMR